MRSGEGRVPSTVLKVAWPNSLIGALRCLGSLVGEKPPSPTMTMLPIRSLIASAAPALTRLSATTTTSVLNRVFRISTPRP